MGRGSQSGCDEAKQVLVESDISSPSGKRRAQVAQPNLPWSRMSAEAPNCFDQSQVHAQRQSTISTWPAPSHLEYPSPKLPTLLNDSEIFAPGPTFRDDLEESRSNGACARFQRSRHDVDRRRLDLRKAVECLERRTMPHCSFEVRNGQLQVSSL